MLGQLVLPSVGLTLLVVSPLDLLLVLTVLGKHPDSRPGFRIRWRHFGTEDHRAVREIKCILLHPVEYGNELGG
jgi:hypothetical protein